MIQATRACGLGGEGKKPDYQPGIHGGPKAGFPDRCRLGSLSHSTSEPRMDRGSRSSESHLLSMVMKPQPAALVLWSAVGLRFAAIDLRIGAF